MDARVAARPTSASASRARARGRAPRCRRATRVRRPGLVAARSCRRPTRRPRSGWADRPLLAGVAEARHVPRPPVAHLPAAQRTDPQGPDLRADRRDDRGGDHVAARDARRRAQLGLPLQLDPRLHVHAVGAVHARLRRGGERLLLLRRRRGRGRGGRAPDHVRDRRRERARGAGARPPVRLRDARPVRIGNGAYNQRQHDVWGAVLDSIYLHTRSRDQLPERLWPIIKRQVEAALDALARARPRDLGGARGAQALHLLEADVLGGRRPRGAAGASCATTTRLADALAGGGRRDPRRHLRERASTSAACSSSTTTPTRSTPRCC